MEIRAVIQFKWRHFQGNIIKWAVQRYCRGDVSYRDLACKMRRRGITVDHSTLCRWVRNYAPAFDKPAGNPAADARAWSVEEHAVRLGGRRKYLYRAVDRSGNTVDFFLSGIRRGKRAARRRIGKALDSTSDRKMRRKPDAAANRRATGPLRTKAGTAAIAPVPFKPARLRPPVRHHPPDTGHDAGKPDERPAPVFPTPHLDPETSRPPCRGAWPASAAFAVRLAQWARPHRFSMLTTAVFRQGRRLRPEPCGQGRMAVMAEKPVSA